MLTPYRHTSYTQTNTHSHSSSRGSNTNARGQATVFSLSRPPHTHTHFFFTLDPGQSTTLLHSVSFHLFLRLMFSYKHTQRHRMGGDWLKLGLVEPNSHSLEDHMMLVQDLLETEHMLHVNPSRLPRLKSDFISAHTELLRARQNLGSHFPFVTVIPVIIIFTMSM